MTWHDTLIGALLLRHDTFATLRERSDVFFRGFVVLFVAGIIAGAFLALVPAIQRVTPLATQEQVIAEARAIFARQFRGPEELGALFDPYVTNITSMVYEISAAEPRGGAVARPIGGALEYIGRVLATPFSWQWLGWTLFAGLIVQFASRLLGGRSGMAQMLGLTSLAAAPQLFTALAGLFALIGVVTNTGVFNGIDSILGALLAIWSAVIYVKATAVAQGFSWLRAVGAIALGFGILLLVLLAVIFLFGLVVAWLIVPMLGLTQ